MTISFSNQKYRSTRQREENRECCWWSQRPHSSPFKSYGPGVLVSVLQANVMWSNSNQYNTPKVIWYVSSWNVSFYYN